MEKVFYIGTPDGTTGEAGHLAKSAGIARYAEARGWSVESVPCVIGRKF